MTRTSFYFYFLISVSVQVSLHTPRLISRDNPLDPTTFGSLVKIYIIFIPGGNSKSINLYNGMLTNEFDVFCSQNLLLVVL